MSRVLSLAELAEAAREWRAEGAVIVLACGCFDPLHNGHTQHLKAARLLGNVLVVAVTADAFVNKGPRRPRIPEAQRAEVVSDLRCVDAVVVNHAENATGIIATLRPHVFAKGHEYRTNRTPQIIAEEHAMKAFGPFDARVEYVTGRVVCSSTAILAGV